MSPNDQAEAMARLDPETRALLELSSKEISDQEIGDLLRLDAEEIAERRRRAELRLSLELASIEKPRRRSYRAAAATAVLLVVAAAVVAIVVSSGGDDETSKPSKATPSQEQKAAAAEAGPVRTMERLNSTHARGTAQIVRRDGRVQLRLRLTDFLIPNGGGYAVWLFNSVDDSRRLYATAGTTINTDLRLPNGYRRYEFVDVARAVPDLDSRHTGISLLRVPLSALAP
jgi:hypothetical protein